MAWIALPALLLLFLALVCIRAALFVPKPKAPAAAKSPVTIDSERAIKNLQAMIKIKTVSIDEDGEPGGLSYKDDFNEFRALLPQLYPLLHRHCSFELVGTGGLLYHWKGKAADKPSVYMAHYDVVPADEDKWQKPPFSGAREAGEIWGRGTLDTKGTLCAALNAAEALLSDGFVPAQDVYFAFGGDEELKSTDAPAIVDLLHSRGVRPALVLDEGGAVVDNVFPGVAGAVALIGTGEKGRLNVEFSVSGMGGHASAPPASSPVGVLARAVTRVEAEPFSAYICEPVRQMFDTLGRHSTFFYRLIFANLWCFKGLLFHLCKKKGGELNALVRTTCAFTQMRGSSASNVLPPSASVNADVRIMRPDTVESVISDLQKRIQDERIRVAGIKGVDPSPFSNKDCEGYERLCSAIGAIWPQAIISPYLMIAASDSRHFCKISDAVLRFSAMYLSRDDRKRIHGNDERIRESQFLEAVKFYHYMLLAS
ncbi:MAG: M20/M25/M40 family metallo-hydrolase [Spirochaetes bacterium]|nr:M20/M25/M40 family metallo-hydrolase [Spirochaetota bacterium]